MFFFLSGFGLTKYERLCKLRVTHRFCGRKSSLRNPVKADNDAKEAQSEMLAESETEGIYMYPSLNWELKFSSPTIYL